MTLTLYKNNSEQNAVTKSLTQVQTMTGTLRNGTSIIDPVILVSDVTDISGVNYCKINEFACFHNNM